MGNAVVNCIEGCLCHTTNLHGHNNEKLSQIHMQRIAVTQAPNCVIKIQGGHTHMHMHTKADTYTRVLRIQSVQMAASRADTHEKPVITSLMRTLTHMCMCAAGYTLQR